VIGSISGSGSGSTLFVSIRRSSLCSFGAESVSESVSRSALFVINKSVMKKNLTGDTLVSS
jgi:hypothetical protein